MIEPPTPSNDVGHPSPAATVAVASVGTGGPATAAAATDDGDDDDDALDDVLMATAEVAEQSAVDRPAGAAEVGGVGARRSKRRAVGTRTSVGKGLTP
jgi:hypothetical protein